MECRAEGCENPVRQWSGQGSRAIRYCSTECRTRQNNRNNDRKERYGVHGATLDDYDRLFMEQEGRCAICRTETPGGANTRFAFDHDHQTNRSRGLLCYLCNVGLGSFQDDPALLQAAIRYLEHPPAAAAINPGAGQTSAAINPR